MAVLTASGPAQAAPVDGAAGIGDPYFPKYGNGGYRVDDYDLSVVYDPATDRLRGSASITARATADLRRFNLDLVGLEVGQVAVDGEPATFSRRGRELRITPSTALDDGSAFTVTVAYRGRPVTFPRGLRQSGFIHTDDGAVVSGEPQAAAAWFPVNDHPADKATYTFRVTVPVGLRAVANGLPVSNTTSGRWRTEVWRATEPMASYLATIAIGRWDVRRQTTEGGIPIINAVDPDVGRGTRRVLARQPEIIDTLAANFGPYPFGAAGAIIDDGGFLPLETQTRPIYSEGFFGRYGSRDFLILHEMAHQWFGNVVSVGRWRDVWLNEGFATYAELLWAAHRKLYTPQQYLEGVHAGIPADDPFWRLSIGDPGPDRLFDQAVYVRGAMTLQALQMVIGRPGLRELLRTWVENKSGGNGTTREFIALAEDISGRSLGTFFRRWLYTPTKPQLPSSGGRAAAVVDASAAAAVTAWLKDWRSAH